MDWIVELAESNGYIQIWVIVDRFSKMMRLIPLPTNTTAKDLAQSFLMNIWRFHGLPEDIISDWDTKLTSYFWQALMDEVGIKTKLSIAFHPETDGQSEWMNQVLEEYFRYYYSWRQDNWEELLPLAEFAINSASLESTGMSLFEANYSYIPCLSWEPIGKVQYYNPASILLEGIWKGTWNRLQERILKARIRMTRWFNQYQRE